MHAVVKFFPGQWLDVFIPGMPKAGGFTITSTPREALPPKPDFRTGIAQPAFLELAIQYSPANPPAAWLWQPWTDIAGADLLVRVGGSFAWPPLHLDPRQIRRVVFVAGGVGIK